MANNYIQSYHVDLVLCIDCTETMDHILDIIKQRALSFYGDVQQSMAYKDKQISQLRVRWPGVKLVGNESQTVGPEDAPKQVHLILSGAEVVLLEGLVLDKVEEGSYLLSAAPMNLGGSDGAPCRAYLVKE